MKVNLLWAAMFALSATGVIAAPATAETIFITNAHLIDGVRDSRDVTIEITDGKVVAIGSDNPDASRGKIIDADGQPVTSSIYAAATQIGIVEQGGASDTDDRSVASGPLGATYQVAYSVDPNNLLIQEARAQGVARAMLFPGGGSDIFAGSGALIYLRDGSDLVVKANATLFTGGSSSIAAAGDSRGAFWQLIRNALHEARLSKSKKTDHPLVSQLTSGLQLKALRPVVNRDIPLAIWANREIDIRSAAGLARDYDIKVVILGGAEAWRATDVLVGQDISVVLDPLDELPASYELVGARRDNAALLDKAGVRFAFMVSGQGIYLSYNVGPALREGAGIAVANGLSYAAALRAITSSPGEIWGDETTGGLAPGVSADLVIWDGDPLEPSSAPAHIFVGGKMVSRETRQILLRNRYMPAELKQ